MVRKTGEDKSDQRIIDDIAKFGWHCVHILAEGEHVEYSFTVGLYKTFGHPELIIFGLPSKVGHQILPTVADAAKSGQPIDLTQPTNDLLRSGSCCFVEVPVTEYYKNVGRCRWYYQGNGFPMVQIVWPSRSGLFPWHAEATREFRVAQPVLSHMSLGV